MAVGAKACGGPATWLAWSRRVTDGAALEALARQQSVQARAALRARNEISNCLFVTDPGARCIIPEGQREGTCQTGAPNLGPQ